MPPSAGPIIRVTEPGRVPLHLLVQRPLEVGRDCDGLLLVDAELSRRHLVVRSVGARVTVEDLGSTNGTRIDGAPIQGPAGLEPGQVVTFGRCQLVVEPPGGEEAPPSPARGRGAQTAIDLVAAAALASPPPQALLRQSGTLTIVFSDIERSTRRSEELGDQAWMGLLGFHNSLVRRQVERHGGIEVKHQGDGFMLAFRSARTAVSCSIDIQRGLDAHARSRPADGLRVRIGMHAGEAVVDDDDLFGRPVILAARIADQARGGEILVSSLVREIVEARGDLRFGPVREASLKGISGRHQLHPVMWRSADG